MNEIKEILEIRDNLIDYFIKYIYLLTKSELTEEEKEEIYDRITFIIECGEPFILKGIKSIFSDNKEKTLIDILLNYKQE